MDEIARMSAFDTLGTPEHRRNSSDYVLASTCANVSDEEVYEYNNMIRPSAIFLLILGSGLINSLTLNSMQEAGSCIEYSDKNFSTYKVPIKLFNHIEIKPLGEWHDFKLRLLTKCFNVCNVNIAKSGKIESHEECKEVESSPGPLNNNMITVQLNEDKKTLSIIQDERALKKINIHGKLIDFEDIEITEIPDNELP